MRVLLDTNVLLDYLVEREPYYESAKTIIFMCAKKEIDGYIAAHSVMNAFYILRKDFSINERRSILLKLCELVEIVGIDKSKIISSLSNEQFSDFEDRLQTECAIECNAKYIITRNIKDFTHSEIPAIEPVEFLKL